MKNCIICTGMAPALTVSEDTCLQELVSCGNVRVLECGYFALVYSSLTNEEWDRIVNQYPALLRITDDRGQETFRVVPWENGPGHVTDEEVVFGNVASGDMYPVVTVMLDSEVEDRTRLLTEKLSTGLNRLAEVEQMALAVLGQREDRKRTIRNRIVSL